MLLSDLVGAGAAIALAIPPLKDQIFRYKREQGYKKATTSKWPEIRKNIASSWEKNRHGYDGKDSLLLGGGAFGLLLSFLLKLFDR